MFQPQATPYSTFSSYGVGAAIGDFPAFQPTGGGGLVVDSGGPTVFRETVFSPVVASNNIGGRLNFNNTADHNNPRRQYHKMAGHGMEAQENAARDFERERKFEVCLPASYDVIKAYRRQGSNGGGEEE
jgi:hypothetical protein